MWKADLSLGEVRVPVKLYAAVQDSKIHFRLLHAKDDTPVKQQMVDPETQEPVAPEHIVRAVQVERGLFVRLTSEEQASLEPKPSRDITIERVVPAAKLDERWFDRPYYLGPDGDDRAYFALAAALEARESVGIAHWTMRKKSYAGALYASDGYLLLDTLRNAREIVAIDSLRAPPSRAPDAREIKLAEQLIGTLEDTFDPETYRDEHREKVLELLEAKAKGKVVRFPRAKARKPSDSLLADLKASLSAGAKRSGKRAGGGRSAHG
jgi:DNA end-binding protein Ku